MQIEAIGSHQAQLNQQQEKPGEARQQVQVMETVGSSLGTEVKAPESGHTDTDRDDQKQSLNGVGLSFYINDSFSWADTG